MRFFVYYGTKVAITRYKIIGNLFVLVYNKSEYTAYQYTGRTKTTGFLRRNGL